MISKILCRLSSFLLIIFLTVCTSDKIVAQGNCYQFDIIGGNAPKGDFIWVPVRVYHFDSLLAFQIGLAYDPLLVMPIAAWTNPNLQNFSPATNINFPPTKIVTCLWFNPVADCTSVLADGDTLIMIKFKLIGEPGSCTDITFTTAKVFLNEVVNCIGDGVCVEDINPNNNQICIGEPIDLCVIAHSCGTITNTGTITVKPFGGMPPYIVTRKNPPGAPDTLLKSGDSKTYNNLFPGLYQILVTDAKGKDTTLTISIGFNSPIVIMPAGITQPRCLNDSNGVISINITGGSGDFTIGWRPINVYSLTTVNHLKVGKYTVTVTDTAGCVANEDFLLFADTIFTKVDIIKDATCADDGVAIARAFGGRPCPPNNTYCFTWSQHQSANVCDTVSRNDSLSGKQFVVIEDCRGCKDTNFFEVKLSGDLLDSLIVDSIRCFHSPGMIQSFISSKGTLNIPISFVLKDSILGLVLGGANGVDNYISPKLKKGTYFLNITDNAGCKRSDTIRLSEPDSLEIINIQIDTIESCNPGKDAFLIVRAFGGTPTYDFTWSNNKKGGSIDTLSQGIYTVTVTDINGCTAMKSYTVTKPNGPKIDSFILVHPRCAGDKNGSITVVFSGGTIPYKPIKWNIPGATTATINNLGVGTYSVTITDKNGCSAVDSVVLSASGNALRLCGFTLSDPKCHSNSDGCITVSLCGVQGPPVYTWDNGSQSAINCNLKAGKYCLHVKDGGACPAIDTCFILADPPKIDIKLDNLVAPSCATIGTCDGSASVMANGRDSTYQIIWSSGEIIISSSDTTHKLCAGDQFVIVQNGNICRDTLLFKIPEAVPISIDSISKIPPSCYQSNDGKISLLAKGGTGPYQYKWLKPNVNSPNINNLGDDTYYVDIIDANNCVHQDSVRLRQPDSVRVDIILGSTLDVTCPGKSDGRISTAWTGGNRGPATFMWLPNINPPDSIATNLKEGKYILKVTDVNGCTGTNEYTLLGPPPISFKMTAVDTPRCENDQILFSVIQANGGSGPLYRFTIDNGAPNDINELVPLFSGNYNIRIYDKNNCFIDTSISVLNPTNSLSLDFGKDIDSIYLGDSILLDGKLNASAIIDSIIWTPSNSVHNPSSTISYVSPTKSTLYVLSVIDKNGCIASDQITIIVRDTRKFYVPNIFSPNGDQINDFFTLHIGEGVKAIKALEIFDRWGNKVYYLANPVLDSESLNTWNGRYGNTGDLMNPAVFVYVIEVAFQDGNTIIYRGDLTLTR